MDAAMRQTNWQPEASIKLKELWADDSLTAEQISHILMTEFGRQYTKAAVIGRAFRMRLPRKRNVVRQSWGQE